MRTRLFLRSRSRPTIVAEKAYFSVSSGEERHADFIIELTDNTLISYARRFLNGETDDEPHVIGTIVKEPKPYNSYYSYHIDPDSIQFYDQYLEFCDASFLWAEVNLDNACNILPDCVICPWRSKLMGEVPIDSMHSCQANFRTGGRYVYIFYRSLQT